MEAVVELHHPMQNSAPLHPVVFAVTDRIRARSAATRSAYLVQLRAAAQRKPGAERMGCANVAHAFAAMPDGDKARVTGIDKFRVVAEKGPNIAIVTAYNDLLSAHAPLQHYPDPGRAAWSLARSPRSGWTPRRRGGARRAGRLLPLDHLGRN